MLPCITRLALQVSKCHWHRKRQLRVIGLGFVRFYVDADVQAFEFRECVVHTYLLIIGSFHLVSIVTQGPKQIVSQRHVK